MMWVAMLTGVSNEAQSADVDDADQRQQNDG